MTRARFKFESSRHTQPTLGPLYKPSPRRLPAKVNTASSPFWCLQHQLAKICVECDLMKFMNTLIKLFVASKWSCKQFDSEQTLNVDTQNTRCFPRDRCWRFRLFRPVHICSHWVSFEGIEQNTSDWRHIIPGEFEWRVDRIRYRRWMFTSRNGNMLPEWNHWMTHVRALLHVDESHIRIG